MTMMVAVYMNAVSPLLMLGGLGVGLRCLGFCRLFHLRVAMRRARALRMGRRRQGAERERSSGEECEQMFFHRDPHRV
jgi:hypothetical protein